MGQRELAECRQPETTGVPADDPQEPVHVVVVEERGHDEVTLEEREMPAQERIELGGGDVAEGEEPAQCLLEQEVEAAIQPSAIASAGGRAYRRPRRS